MKITKIILPTLLAFVLVVTSMGTSSLAQSEKIPVYESRLLRLSEIIGSVHFLTLLCKPEEGIIWHDKMQEMLEAEEPSELRRARLIERFNSGFSSFQATYRQCTPSAQTALNRYLNEAQGIVQKLTTDFAG